MILGLGFGKEGKGRVWWRLKVRVLGREREEDIGGEWFCSGGRGGLWRRGRLWWGGLGASGRGRGEGGDSGAREGWVIRVYEGRMRINWGIQQNSNLAVDELENCYVKTWINPTNKREICCDERLKTLFEGKDKVGFLEIGKLLSRHFVKTN
ncbi:hypothetical protein TEA_015279 [Camellia sinensis var. sinensis]|uniref:DM2 domain-containing protein n=1 Tax=Camellia sinensis var. sinensis TaxID=542762 RepID=A0A4S4DE25_CAMSN|nr:hypothetical protein TEA_015279 [Camellia sinensis var. sinensis]